MTQQSQSAVSSHLVDLYAGRVRARYRRPGGPRVSGRLPAGLHRFGRRPKSTSALARRSKGAFAAVMASAVLAGASSGADSASSNYEIQPDDTLTGIAGRHGVTVEDLVRLNGIEDPNHILAGSVLSLDDSTGSPNVGDTVYRIKPGDTLFEIARDHDVALADLLAFNEIQNPDLIYVDDVLIIPTGTATATEDESQDSTVSPETGTDAPETAEAEVASMHLVGSGETLLAIADRYGVPIDLLAEFNDISDVNVISVGTLLQIPSSSAVSAYWERERQQGQEVDAASTSTILQGVPALQQSLSLSCESAAASMATAFWGYQVSEWVFIENMPYHANPHRGFRGDMNGPFGGTDDYGVYARPIASILANYGYVGEEFYSMGDPQSLKHWIDQGVPVLVWMSNMASEQDRFYEWHNGERFTLVPTQHVVVAYGYDYNGVHVADPGDGQHRVFGWDDFLRSWSYFDGMSLAVYPKG